MKEDLITFETAKLAKDKGFNIVARSPLPLGGGEFTKLQNKEQFEEIKDFNYE